MPLYPIREFLLLRRLHIQLKIYRSVCLLVIPILLFSTNLSFAAQQLWQTNSNGDDVYVYRIGDWTLLDKLVVGGHPHGIATAQDNKYIWITVEATRELLWIETTTRSIVHRIKVGRKPQALAVSPDGQWAYIPCRDGFYWVVDLVKRQVVKRIWTGWFPHNTQISTDGRWAFLSPMGPLGTVTVVDISKGHRKVGKIKFDDSPRPPALSADGKRLYQHIDGLFGFQVADTVSRRVVAKITHSGTLGWFIPFKPLGWWSPEGFKRCHGLALRPNHEEIWSTCGSILSVHETESAQMQETKRLSLSGTGYWLTFDAQGRYAFIALKDTDQVAVVDAEAKTVMALLSAGSMPKRNLVVSIPSTSK